MPRPKPAFAVPPLAMLCAAVIVPAAGCNTTGGPRGSADSPGTLASDRPAAAANVAIPGIDRTQAARQGMRDLRDALTAERTQVDRTLTALAAVMQGQGELVPAFQQYTLAIQDAKAARQRVQQQIEAMRTKARDYITGWEVEVYGVEDPDLRRQAEARRNDVRTNYTRLNETLKAARAAYDRFETEVSDLQRFLANDLTRNGVAAAATAAQKANQAGSDLRGRIDAATAELDRVSGELTPAGSTTRGAETAARR